MTAESRRRILVALHPSDELDDALNYAAGLADDLRGELMGLFLEDQALFDLCAMSAVEVSGSTGSARALDSAVLERQLRVAADAARSRVSRLAAERRVSWSFDVRRGRAGEAVIEATERAQLVVATRGAFGALDFARRGASAGPVLALLDRGPGEQATFEAAIRTARRVGAPVVGLLVGERPREERTAFVEVAARAGIQLELRAIENDPERLVRAIAEAAPRLLAIDAHTVGGNRDLLARCLAAARCEAILASAA